MQKTCCLSTFLVLIFSIGRHSSFRAPGSMDMGEITNIKAAKLFLSARSIARGAHDEVDWWSLNGALTASDEGALRRLKQILLERKMARFQLGKSRRGRNIEAWYFPGTSENNALVIGGVHGTELSAIQVAETLIQKLGTGRKGYCNVIVIPCLFPDNASIARSNPGQLGSTANIGRYSFSTAPDPNRQMPTPGKSFEESQSKDHLGRKIEKENQLFLRLISLFKPDRIASIHGIRDLRYAGIYADPRTDSRSYALGFDSDSSLAIQMAGWIFNKNGFVPGNKLDAKPTALYYKDPPPVAEGNLQPRNLSGSSLPFNRGRGISLGTWGSTAISKAKNPLINRDAMRIITIEFPGYKRSGDYKNKAQRNYFRQQTDLYASSIELIFLEKYFTEEYSTRMAGSLSNDEAAADRTKFKQ